MIYFIVLFDSKALQYLTTCISKFPASMQIRSSGHGVADATDPYVCQSQVHDNCVRGGSKFLVLNEDAQNNYVAENTYQT